MSVKATSIPTKTLATSITSAATSFRLNNITGWDGTALVAGDFGSQAYGVFRNAAKTQIELFEFDPATIASTDITILKRGLDFTGDLTTEVAANKLSWTKGDTYVDLGTDTPQLWQWLKEYIDAASIAGAVDATTTVKGIVELPTQSEADAGTAIGGTGAPLAITPNVLRSRNYNDYVLDTGTVNAFVIAPSPAITAYTAGQIFTFKAANTNTGASTINVNSLGVKNIKINTDKDLRAGEILTGTVVTVVYDGTSFQLISHTPSSHVTVFSASGTYTKPTWARFLFVEIWGGGGSGACAHGVSSGFAAASGGGGGEYRSSLIPAAFVGITETVTVGAGGAAVSRSTNGTTGGNDGGASSFGTLLVTGSTTAPTATVADASATTPGSGASGGTTTMLSIKAENGGNGGTGSTVSNGSATNGSNTTYTGAGGGAAFADTTTGSSSGGTSTYAGAGGAGAASSSPSSPTATSGSVPGGGGGGVALKAAGTATSGAGGDGYCVVTAI